MISVHWRSPYFVNIFVRGAPVRSHDQVPALVNFYLFIQICLKMYPVSFPCGLLHDIYRKTAYPYMVHPLLPLPRLYRNLGVIPG